MLDGQATDVLEGSALSFQSNYIDVYSNCWGPKDDGKTFGKPGKLAQEALKQGALKVKEHLLTIFARNCDNESRSIIKKYWIRANKTE